MLLLSSTRLYSTRGASGTIGMVIITFSECLHRIGIKVPVFVTSIKTQQFFLNTF